MLQVLGLFGLPSGLSCKFNGLRSAIRSGAFLDSSSALLASNSFIVIYSDGLLFGYCKTLARMPYSRNQSWNTSVLIAPEKLKLLKSRLGKPSEAFASM